jgi:hypothetical protein
LATSGVLLAGWVCFLTWQVVWYSNPIVVSRPQLLTAPIVAEGDLLADPPRLQVERVWWGELAPKTITLHMNQQDVAALLQDEHRFVVPLVEGKAETYYIWRNGAGGRAVYPATAGVLKQVETVLAHRRDQAARGAAKP